MYFYVGQVIIDLSVGRILRVLGVNEKQDVITDWLDLDSTPVQLSSNIASNVTVVRHLSATQMEMYSYWVA